VAHDSTSVPAFVSWPSFPFEGTFGVRRLDPAVDEPAPDTECEPCRLRDDAFVWVSDRWRVRAPERPGGLPIVLLLETRSHLELGDLPNLLAAELGVMMVRLERAMRSLPGVARVHVVRTGDEHAHLHIEFMARPEGQVQLKGRFLGLWNDVLPPIAEERWRENQALVGAWLADFGGRAMVDPPRIEWQPLELGEV